MADNNSKRYSNIMRHIYRYIFHIQEIEHVMLVMIRVSLISIADRYVNVTTDLDFKPRALRNVI